MSVARRWLLVLNGKAAGSEALREAVAALRGRGVALDVRVTWEQGDAARMVDEALAAGVDTVVAAGGDGTLNAVASALARHEGDADALPSLGLVPMGTANDFARSAGLPESPLEALELVHDCPAVGIDLLEVTADDGVYWAANLASGGFGTQVTLETDERMKQRLGGFAYLLTGLGKLDRIQPVAARFRGDGCAWEGAFLALGVGNGRQAGGGQVLCPDAWIDDGLLDLAIVPSAEGDIRTALRTLLAEGRAAVERSVQRACLPWLEIEGDAPLLLNLDGEPLESSRFRIEVAPRRLRMHLPDCCPLLARARPHPACMDPR